MESVSGEHRTIKALVFDLVHRTNGKVTYDEMTSQVRQHFPASQWKKTHWAYYRHQIARGRFRGLFSEEERENLGGRTYERRQSAASLSTPAEGRSEADAPGPRRPSARDPKVKQIGDHLLDHVRFVIAQVAGEDKDLQFKLNRWIFSRLLQDEIRIKRPIKKTLWEQGIKACQACGEVFDSLKTVELHRKDSTRSYSVDNCELLCRECHQELA